MDNTADFGGSGQPGTTVSRRTVLTAALTAMGSVAAAALPLDSGLAAASVRARQTPTGGFRLSEAVPPSYGAVPIGQASYAIPAGSLFVSTAGSDTAAGSQAAPLRTFAKAASVVTANQTIVIRAGRYHEGRTRTTGAGNGYVAIPISRTGVTVQNYPGEAVWFDGSRVIREFARNGNWWSTAWEPFRRDPQYSWSTDAAYRNAIETDDWSTLDGRDPSGNRAHDKYWQFVDYKYFPAAARPERVWINGVAQIQVASLAAMAPGRFYIDARTRQLYIGESAVGKLVEITDLQTCMNFLGSGATLRGIGIRRFAGSNPQCGVVKFHRANPTIENVVVEDVTPFAVDFVGSASNVGAHDFVANRVTIVRAGNLGIHVDKSDRGRISNSRFKYCNDKRFAYAPSAGAIKATYIRKVTVDQCLFEESYGKHIWCDCDVYNIAITRCVLRRSYQRAVVLELGDKALVAGNVFDQSGVDSLASVDFDGLRCWNNTFVRAGSRRYQPDMSITDWFSNPRPINVNRTNRIPRGTTSYAIDARDRAGTIPPWPMSPGHSPGSSGGNQFRNNTISYCNTQQFLADEDFRKATLQAISHGQAGTDADYNLYQASPEAPPQYPWNWSNARSGNTTAFSIGEVRQKFGREHHGVQLTTTTMCADPVTGQLIDAHRALHQSAAPLPADIAAALGQAPGHRHFGAYPLKL